MKQTILTTAMLTLAVSFHAEAGNLTRGVWAPESCGIKPEPPQLDPSNVEAFNKSVAAVNAWQQQAKSYYECLVNEANKDNSVIADTANREQASYRASIEKINQDAQQAKKKLDGK